jgi:2,5-diamino-6-(ribosylamino)-4(3H)-pyrimidinone 5'-phosphate reductase
MKRPFVFINSAMSADGKISSIERRQVRISGKQDLARVAELRAKSDAIMVGIGTVLADDPGLRIKSEILKRKRLDEGRSETPLRVVTDSLGRTPLTAEILGDGCIVAVSEAAPLENVEALSKSSEVVTAGAVRVNLPELLEILHEKGVRKLMVEGGATLNWSLVQAGLVDEIYVYIGSMLFGGEDAPTLIDGAGFAGNFPMLELISLEQMDEGALIRWSVASER